MACFSGPEIVNSNLVFCLDAANLKSYPGTGTTWTDLINQSACTLTNGPIFSSTNGKGAFAFDGVNDYCNFTVPNLSTVATVEMWVKTNSTVATDMMFSFGNYNVNIYGSSTSRIAYNTLGGDYYGVSGVPLSAWQHFCFVMRTDVTYVGNNKIYWNGVDQTLTQFSTGENAANRTFNSGVGSIARVYNTGYESQIDVGIFKVYNIALSITEVKQNFEATRGRYGL